MVEPFGISLHFVIVGRGILEIFDLNINPKQVFNVLVTASNSKETFRELFICLFTNAFILSYVREKINSNHRNLFN